MWHTYLLLCNDQTIYTGITNDLQTRLETHKNGLGGRYTRSRGAKKIIYSENHRTRSAALKREAQIKKLKRVDKVLLVKSYNSKKSI